MRQYVERLRRECKNQPIVDAGVIVKTATPREDETWYDRSRSSWFRSRFHKILFLIGAAVIQFRGRINQNIKDAQQFLEESRIKNTQYIKNKNLNSKLPTASNFYTWNCSKMIWWHNRTVLGAANTGHALQDECRENTGNID